MDSENLANNAAPQASEAKAEETSVKIETEAADRAETKEETSCSECCCGCCAEESAQKTEVSEAENDSEADASKTEKFQRPVIEVTGEMLEKSRTTLATMLDYLGLEATIKAESRPSKINLVISSNDAGRIIGRKGQSLESLQVLLNRMMQRGDEPFPKIYIDIDGYSSGGKRGEKREGGHFDREDRRRRGPKGPRSENRREERDYEDASSSGKEEQLRQQAVDTAKEVRRWGDPVTLPPMNAHDRRIIHITLENESDIQTESTGEGSLKNVVVSLKK